MGKVLRFILLLPFLPLIYAFSYQALLFITEIELKDVVFFLLGLAVYLLLYVLLWKGGIDFLETLEHELTHAITSIAFFHMPESLVVNSEARSGQAGVTKTVGCFPVLLAPYFLPLFTLPLLLVKPLAPAPFDNVVDFLIGFTLAFHYVRVIIDLLQKQSDITRAGTIFSIVVLIFLNLIFLVLILAVVAGNYSGIVEYAKASFERTKVAYKTTYETTKSLDLSFLEELHVPGE